MNLLRIGLLILCCCTFLGCPYLSDVPLSGKRYKIGNYMVGKWKKCPENGPCTYLLVTRDNDYEYNLTYRSYDTPTSKWKTETNQAFLSNVANSWYLNIEIGNQYQVSKVVQYSSSLYLHTLDDHAFMDENSKQIKFKTSQEFSDYLDFYSPKSDLFSPPRVFEKY